MNTPPGNCAQHCVTLTLARKTREHCAARRKLFCFGASLILGHAAVADEHGAGPTWSYQGATGPSHWATASPYSIVAAGRLLKRLQELRQLDDAVRDPYFHLVDGAVSDNRGVLDVMETFEALRLAGQRTPLDHARRIIIFVVNSVSSPSTKWNKRESPPGSLTVLTKAAGVPIDRYASESIELLKDIGARWAVAREIRDSHAFEKDRNPKLVSVENAPNADVYTIEISFQALKDNAERDYLNHLPTSFSLPTEAIDRLRAAAGKIILDSPDFQELLKNEGAHVAD